MHISLDEFEFQPDPATDYGVTCHRASEKLMYNVVNILATSSLIGSSSFFGGNKDNYKVSDELEIRPDPTMDCGVRCP